MTKVVFVGDIYYSDLRPDQGLPPWQGGQPSHPIYAPPPYPDQGLPPGSPGAPSHPIYHPGHPDHGRPSHPIAQPPGSIHHPIYNPAYPDQGLPPGSPGSPSHPIQGVPPGPSHPWVPPSGEQLPPPPAEIADNTVVAVWQPSTQMWTVTVFEASHQPS